DIDGSYTATLVVRDATGNSAPATYVVTAQYLNTIAVSFQPSNMLTYSTTTGIVHLQNAAGGTQKVNLSSNNPGLASVPSSVTIPQDQQDVDFNVQSFASTGSATITGFATGLKSGAAGLSVSARTITLTTGSSLMQPGSTTPATLSLSDLAPCIDPF